MAQKKQAAKKRTTKEKVLKPREESVVKRTPSYVNLVYGAVTVIVLFLLIFFAVRTFTNHNAGEITEESVQDSQEQTEGTYEVKAGDTLWSIAESELGSGYEWREILDANEIKDPTNLTAGTRLVIPEKDKVASETAMTMNSTPSATIEPTATTSPVATLTIAPTSQPEKTAVPEIPKISGTEYVVKPGDTLWDIAVRSYGDGYKWVEIAQKNNLTNPDLIFSGNNLIITR